MDETQQAVIDWLSNGEVGESSKCMAMWLAFGKRAAHGSHPHDPDDLDRCLKLLQRAPGLRAMLPAMAGMSGEWAALVARWDEVEEVQLDEIGINWVKARRAPKTYALMCKIFDGVRQAA